MPAAGNANGTPFSVDEILIQLSKSAPFIEGITVSGGEATTQLPFLVALFTAIKADPALQHLTCLVDSNGLLGETGWQKLLPVFDGAMVDLKAWGNEHHRFLTGRENPQIKHSIRWLAHHQRLAELRLLVIPEQCDYLEHLKALTAFIHALGNVPVRINAFHAHGVTVKRRPGAAPRPKILSRWRGRWNNSKSW